jgi:hypothetical protein
VRSWARLAAFAVAIAVVFAGALAVGGAFGPIDVGDAEEHAAPGSPATTGALPGLAVAQGGFRLVLERDQVPATPAVPFSFRLVDDGGTAVTTFDEVHERRLHLIVVGRNLVDYWHLHPTMDAAGRWTADLPALPPGSYRVLADVKPTGHAGVTLGADLSVAGTVAATELPPVEQQASVDGYDVTMMGDPQLGESSFTFAIERDGQAITTEPYLGAAGHLVSLRAADLAYLHVHPLEAGGDPSAVRFAVELPSAGTYRLFFEFAHEGTVRTAAFTVELAEAGAPVPAPAAPGSGEHGEEH